MKKVIFFMSFLIYSLKPYQSLAWGASGHKLIAEIAFKYLDDQTKRIVLAYLNGMSIEEASNWMDEVRGDHSYDYMKPYHYADFDRGQLATNITGDNIIGVLNSTLRDLNQVKQLSTAQIRTELLFLMHLVGDIHQPLHVGYAEDKGGNTYQVSFMGKGSNLHKVWDSEIIDYENMSLQYVLSANKLNTEQIATIQIVNIVSWANESRAHLEQVYSIQGHKINEQYINRVYPIIAKQLLYAGLRLAAILEKYFKNISQLPKPPITPSPSKNINSEDAANHVGEMITVCGKVFGGKYLKNSNGSPTLIDMGGDYPNNPFTVVINGSNRGVFSYKPEEYLIEKPSALRG